MNEQTEKKGNSVFGVLKADIFGILIFVILTLLTSAVFYFFMVKEDIIPIAFNIILFLSAFVTGIKASHTAQSKGYLKGFFSGIILVILMAVIFWIFKKPITAKNYITYIIMILLSSFGGIVGINSK